MPTPRQYRVLDIFMDLYIQLSEPISSLLLARHSGKSLNIKNSAIRIELVALEAEGYIKKSYKTQGRIPTNKGYKYYLENLITEPNSKVNLKKRLEEILKKRERGINWIVSEAINLIDSSIKPLVVTKKMTNNIYLEDLKIYLINNNRAIILAVGSNGEVYNKEIQINSDQIDDLNHAINILSPQIIGRRIQEIEELLPNLKKLIHFEINELEWEFQRAIIDIFDRMILSKQEVSGTGKIVGKNYFQDLTKLEKLFEFVENQKIWEALEQRKAIKSDKNKILLGIDDFDEISIIERELQVGKNCTKVALVNNKGQKYREVFTILEMLEEELKNE